MKKFKLTSFLLIFVLLAAMLPTGAAAADDPPELDARVGLLMDADSGQILFDQGGEDTNYPASTTKIMTALLVTEAVEKGEIALDDMVTAYDDCQYNMDEDSSNANPVIDPGERLSVQDLLYCAMLASANEACNILAEYVCGSVSEFVALMNRRAAELGCTGTNFTNANGLEDASHYTTARDLALIAREAVKHQLFLDVCGAPDYTTAATDYNTARNLENTNLLLDSESRYYYEYAYGVKTGFFTAAGRCLVAGALYDDMNIICVVLGGEESDDEDPDDKTRTQYSDTIALYDWAWENFSNQTVLSSTTVITTLPVSAGTADAVGVRAETALNLLLPNGFDAATLESQYVFYHERDGVQLNAPVSAGQRLGEIVVLRDGRQVGFSYLVASSAVEMSKSIYIQSQFGQIFRQPVVRRLITAIIIIFALYLILVCFYRVQRLRHLRSIRRAKRIRAETLAHNEIVNVGLPEEELSYSDDDYGGELPQEEPSREYDDELPGPEDPPDDLSDDDYADLFRK